MFSSVLWILTTVGFWVYALLLCRRNLSAARRNLREKEVIVRSQASLDRTLQDKADKYAQLQRLVEQIEKKVIFKSLTLTS